MTTIDPSILAAVSGGFARGQSPEQIRERYRNICLTPNPQTARAQYDQMVKEMVPDKSEAAGVKRRAVKSIGNLCHWPVPGP